jgi:hypothetical protein
MDQSLNAVVPLAPSFQGPKLTLRIGTAKGCPLSTVNYRLPFYNGTGVESMIPSNMASVWSDFLRVEI